MNRRETLKATLTAAGAAVLSACSDTKQSPAQPAAKPLAAAADKTRAHSLAMILLMLKPDYFQEVIDNAVPPGGSKDLLKKVDPTVYKNIRDYFTKLKPADLDAARKVAKDFQYLAVRAANWDANTGAPKPMDQSTYSTPEDCPCPYQRDCAEVELLFI